jgi:hypothetical protein
MYVRGGELCRWLEWQSIFVSPAVARPNTPPMDSAVADSSSTGNTALKLHSSLITRLRADMAEHSVDTPRRVLRTILADRVVLTPNPLATFHRQVSAFDTASQAPNVTTQMHDPDEFHV